MGNNASWGCVPQKREPQTARTANYQDRIIDDSNQIPQYSYYSPRIQKSETSLESENYYNLPERKYTKSMPKKQPVEQIPLRQRQSIMNMKEMVKEFIKPPSEFKDTSNQQCTQKYKPKPKRQSSKKMANAYYQMTGRPI